MSNACKFLDGNLTDGSTSPSQACRWKRKYNNKTDVQDIVRESAEGKSPCSGRGPVVDTYTDGYEPAGSVQAETSVDYLNGYYVHGLLDPEDRGTTILRNGDDYLGYQSMT
jgi:hypothetical protein